MNLLYRRQRLGVAALLLAGSAFLSRLMGLLRDKLISWQFGAGNEADLYFAAFVTPDIINYLLAGGFMSITIIPILGRLFQDDEKDAWDFFSCIVLWMTGAAIFLTLLGEIWADALGSLTAPGFTPEQLARLAFFTRIILPGQIFFLAGAPFTALLFLRGQFSAPAFSPLIYNGSIILFGASLPCIPMASHAIGMTGYCIGVSVGAFAGAFLLPWIVAKKSGITFRLVLYHPALKKFFWIALPLMLGQTVVMLDEQFLRIFGSMLEEGSVSILNYARRLTQVPISLVGQAAAVASYPFLVKLLAQGQSEKFSDTLNTALKTSITLIVPCAMFMIACAGPILGLIFEGGKFGPAETALCTSPTQIMLASSPFWVMYMILARAFYAYSDTLTPAITGTVITLVAIPVYYFLAIPIGINGIASVSFLALAAYLLWLVVIWAKRHGHAAFTGLGRTFIKACLCAFIPSSAALLCCFYMQRIQLDLPLFFNNLIICSLGGVSFLLFFIPLAIKFQPALIIKIKSMLGGRGNKTP